MKHLPGSLLFILCCLSSILAADFSPPIISSEAECDIFQPVHAETIAYLRSATDRRIEEIRSTPNMDIPADADCRYISEKHGNDDADGKTPATAWKTLARLRRETLPPGAFVLFERGGTYRGQFITNAGVTYTAYGTGEKPKLYASPENGADPSKWVQTDIPNIWCYQIGNRDVGTIVFNDGEQHAIKEIPIYNPDGSFTQQYSRIPFDNGYKDLVGDLHFWHDYSDKTKFKPHAQGSGKLYLVSEKNPGERFKSIEFCIKQHIVIVIGEDATVDNLCLKYTGAHGIHGLKGINFRATNCEFGWIGGSIQSEDLFGHNWPVRFGNGVELNTCIGYTVDNCYFYQVYDAAITHQDALLKNDPTYIIPQKDIRYSNNVIEYCNYSIEYFMSRVHQCPTNPSRMENFVIENNLMWNAAEGFCQQRPDKNMGAHIKSWRNNSNRATGFVIRNNLVAYSREMLVEISAGLTNPDGSDSMPVVEGNVFVGRNNQRFGVLNQGSPEEHKFSRELPDAIAQNAKNNIFLYLE